eukprot:3838937-Amphidinium_carterae.1
MQEGDGPETSARGWVLATFMKTYDICLPPRSGHYRVTHAAREKQGKPMKKSVRHVLEHFNSEHVPPRTFTTMHAGESNTHLRNSEVRFHGLVL